MRSEQKRLTPGYAENAKIRIEAIEAEESGARDGVIEGGGRDADEAA